MKRFLIERVLHEGKWFYDKKAKAYKQKTIIMKEVNSYKKAFEEYKKLHKDNVYHTYRIVFIEG